ncbi:DNA-binding transcriptional ArsR family regulator [Microbacterium sp. AK009]|uniref:ArsR/SmtB family transcription factor n=1 Tax=Microbacterium sp. AK009 TaxID=2723068 RepID=UPI0017EBC836|nr:metalloregulator ArsR/SmtB family transcription factor [Microbacterium sp. AK009]NYF18043.1 DNA-binding transcriptional ArsR family regulator [Microbacterium sp. AK009]
MIIILNCMHKLRSIYVFCFDGDVEREAGLEATAALFKVLGSPSRLYLLRLLAAEPAGVSALVKRSEMSQPLVSQHLRTLRQAGIVTVSRTGREAVYQLADYHIAHVVNDAITHVLEEDAPDKGDPDEHN